MGAAAPIDFASLFSPTEILCNETGERDAILRRMLERLALQRGIGNVDDAYEAVLAREKVTSTIIAPGLAVPHARLEAISQLVVCVATCREGVEYNGEESAPVKLIILILAPKDAPGLYLQALSALAKICQDPATPETLAVMDTADDVYRFFERGGVVLPDHVCAGDVMDKDVISLSENDTLEKAIDTFVRHRLTDLPVVDIDGDLVGVVTAHELLRVCLPDYILWMEDLSPILNFEPFAEILRNESNTWLAEIMNFDYATVSEDAPAVQVAKEITRRGTGQAYVTRGKKLAGVITLEDFLDKVLRE